MPDGITTDQLNIKITVDSSGAVSGIETVKKALGELKDVAASTNLTHLKDLANSFTALKESVSTLANVNFSSIGAGISNLFSAISRVASDPMLSANLQTTTDALKQLVGPLYAFTSHTTGLESAANGISKLQSAIEKFGNGPSPEQIAALEAPLKQVGQAVGSVGKGGNNLNQMKNGIEGLTKAIENFNPRGLEKLSPVLEELKEQFAGFSADAQKGASAFYRIANALRSLNETGFDANLASNIKNSVSAIKDFAESVINAIPNSVLERFIALGNSIHYMTHMSAAGRSVNAFSNHLKNAHFHASALTKALKRIGSVALSSAFLPFRLLGKAADSAGTSLKKVGSAMLNVALSPIKQGINAVSRFGQAFKRFGETIKRLVFYRFLRSMIRMITQQVKLGIDALYAWSDVVGYRFKAAMDGLATSFQYLRNSVAAMISPLIEYVQPIIDTLIDKFVEFLNVVNQFIAMMTGKSTWVRAIKGAAAYAEETGYAAAAQDRLNRTVLGFDELNKLEDTKDRNHGSPTADAGGGEFEELPITESFKNMEIDFGDLGKKISDALAHALDSIKWPTIQRKVNGVVQKIVDFFNGFFGNKDLWISVGNTIGEGLNTITGAMLTFSDGVEWGTIGANIADGFKKAIQSINWANLGRALVSTLKIIRDLAVGFADAMTPEDWKALKDGVSEAITAALSEFNITWSSVKTGVKKVVQTVAKYFSQFFSDKSTWKNVGNAAAEGLNFVTDTILTFTDNVDWEGIGNGIAEGVRKAVKKINWTNLGKTLSSTLKIFTNLFHGFVSGMTAQDWSDLGKGIGDAVTSAITDIDWEQVIPDLVDFTICLLQAFISAIANIDWNKILDALWKGIKGANWKGVFTQMEGLWAKLSPVLRLVAVFEGTKALLGISSFVVQGAEKLGSLIPKIANVGTEFKTLENTVTGAVNFGMIPSILGLIAIFGTLGVAADAAFNSESNAARDSTNELVDNLLKQGKITQDQANKFKAALYTGSREAKAEVERQVNEIATQYGLLPPAAERTGKKIPESLRNGITGGKSFVTSAVNTIANKIKILNSSRDDSPFYPYTWGTHLAQNFADGLSSQSSYVDKAARTVAQTARNVLAFSVPKLGPLSDADMYGPDFMKLYAEGIEKSKYLVTDAVRGVASDVNNQMAMENAYTLNNQPTGLDSLAQAITESETPINVYVGNDKLDSVIARSNGRLNYRSGGKF